MKMVWRNWKQHGRIGYGMSTEQQNEHFVQHSEDPEDAMNCPSSDKLKRPENQTQSCFTSLLNSQEPKKYQRPTP